MSGKCALNACVLHTVLRCGVREVRCESVCGPPSCCDRVHTTGGASAGRLRCARRVVSHPALAFVQILRRSPRLWRLYGRDACPGHTLACKWWWWGVACALDVGRCVCCVYVFCTLSLEVVCAQLGVRRCLSFLFYCGGVHITGCASIGPRSCARGVVSRPALAWGVVLRPRLAVP